MSFRVGKTLAGYARAAVDLRKTEYCRDRFAQQYLKAFLEPHLDHPDESAAQTRVLDAFAGVAHQPWQDGEPYVLAPAMTAIIAAAAQTRNLTGDIVGNDARRSCSSGSTSSRRTAHTFSTQKF